MNYQSSRNRCARFADKLAPRGGGRLSEAHKPPPGDSTMVSPDAKSHADAIRFGGEKSIECLVRLSLKSLKSRKMMCCEIGAR